MKRLNFTAPSKYVIEAVFGAKMKIFKSPDQHHNVIITVGSDAIEIIENTFKNLERRIFKCKIKIKIDVLCISRSDGGSRDERSGECESE